MAGPRKSVGAMLDQLLAWGGALLITLAILVLPIVIVSSREAIGAVPDSIRQGAYDYLMKPFDLRELEARARALIRRSSGERSGVIGSERVLLHTVESPFWTGPLRSPAAAHPASRDAPSPPRPAPAAASRAGERVRHAKFGVGEIVEAQKGRVVVRFGSEERIFVPELAPLSKA